VIEIPARAILRYTKFTVCVKYDVIDCSRLIRYWALGLVTDPFKFLPYACQLVGSGSETLLFRQIIEAEARSLRAPCTWSKD
jgi:hypothetical protein